MTIREMILQGLYYARTCRSLWLFGFFVGIASGGSNGGGGGGGRAGSHGSAAGAAVGAPAFSGTGIALIVSVIVAVIVVGFVMRFISEGALIEGVVRARQGGMMTTGEGFRRGWAHWGVLLRIALIYFAVILGSAVLLAAPCVMAYWAFGPIGGILAGIAALVIAVPWLVTLSLVQAFGFRIAVLENRHALDAIAKARLFLHGRLLHGLKLIVATFIGTLGLVVVGMMVILPVVLVLAALVPVLQIVPVLILGCLVLLPVLAIFAAIVGTFRSSIWTIGYVTQVGS
jgi:hypothetical protein